MEPKITLKELAKLLNVSVSTVSKALNDSHEISEKTKTRIKELAQTNNYVPNESAQHLKGKKSKTIGIIIPNVLAHFFAMSLNGIETMASKLGYKIVVCISNESVKKEAESIRTLVNSNVDGIIMSLSKETQATQEYNHFSDAIKLQLPIVLFDRISKALLTDTITINDEEAAFEAAKKLCSSGCNEVIYLSTIGETSVDLERLEGYSKAVREIGCDPYIIHLNDYSCFEENLLQVLQERPVDGILAADELSAISAMKTALMNGYRIPEDISVIGFTNGILGEKYIPSLTAVDQNAEEQGQIAVEILAKRIEEKLLGEPVHKVLKTRIIQRDSSRKGIPSYGTQNQVQE